MRAPIVVALAVLLGGTAYGVAQIDHSAMDHDAHMPGMSGGSAKAGSSSSIEASSTLAEPGQGAFAALSEVVRVLEADPGTDWSRIDLTGLRNHLVDMDRLVTRAEVSERRTADGLEAIASGDLKTLATLRRMIPAHAAQLARDERWKVSTLNRDDGVELTVAASDPATVARIQGLGFFGLMASQDHHREHHLMLALGKDAGAH